MTTPNFTSGDRVRLKDFPNSTGTVNVVRWVGTNHPQASIVWDDPDDLLSINILFSELEYIPDPDG